MKTLESIKTIAKQLKKYKRKNELHAPFTAPCACSLQILNQKKGDNSIRNLINVQLVVCQGYEIHNRKEET